MQLKDCVCSHDFRDAAKKRMKFEAFEYIDSGAGKEITLRENEKQYHRLIIVPRILKSIPNPTINTNIFGISSKMPFGFAPWAMGVICHDEGENLLAKVAQEKGAAYCLSILSTKSFREIKDNNGNGIRLLQLYISKDWNLTEGTIRLAEKYGFQGLVITVDTQVLGKRNRQAKNPLDSSAYKYPVLEQMNKINKSSEVVNRKSYQKNRDLSMNWETIKKIKESTKLKIVLKGILNVKDAQEAINYCDAIWVSNHGGRQLDTVPSTIEVLPMIKAAVKGKLPIFIDGGVRTGNDIFKCLALGADYVFIGRPFAYSLTFGYEGVKKMVQIFEDELLRAMILVGCHNLKDINSLCITHKSYL